MRIFVGSHEGVLRVFQPTKTINKKENNTNDDNNHNNNYYNNNNNNTENRNDNKDNSFNINNEKKEKSMLCELHTGEPILQLEVGRFLG